MEGSVRLVSWNILQGGGRRLAGILDAIEEWSPDIITLQEMRGRNLEKVADRLKKLGLTFSYLSVGESDTENGIFIAARTSIDAGDFIQDRTGICHILETEVAGLTLLPVHFPQKAAQVPLFEAVAQDSGSLLELNAVLIGDLNCGIPFEDSTAKTFANTNHFQACKDAGWIDAYRQLCGATARDFSWVSPRTGRGFRYDHALVSPSLSPRLAAIRYDHLVREKGLSDHSALLLDLA